MVEHHTFKQLEIFKSLRFVLVVYNSKSSRTCEAESSITLSYDK